MQRREGRLNAIECGVEACGDLLLRLRRGTSLLLLGLQRGRALLMLKHAGWVGDGDMLLMRRTRRGGTAEGRGGSREGLMLHVRMLRILRGMERRREHAIGHGRCRRVQLLTTMLRVLPVSIRQ